MEPGEDIFEAYPDWKPEPHARFDDPTLRSIQWSEPLADDQVRFINQIVALRPELAVRIYPRRDDYDWSQLALLPDVRRFAIQGYHLSSFDCLHLLNPAISQLTLAATRSKRPSLDILDHFRSLKRLTIDGHVKGIKAIARHTNLESLYLRSVTLEDLSLLSPLTQLRWLWLGLGGTKDLRPIATWTALEYLELWMIRGFDSLAPIASCPSLREVHLQSLPRVADINPLARVPHLHTVTIEHMKGLANLTPLRQVATLRHLRVIDCCHLKPDAFACLTDHPSLASASVGLGSDRKNRAVLDLLDLPPVDATDSLRQLHKQ
ncbi:hypothetical protein MNBD_PLANCTO03-429 [hydrothermal vent metagenome]|uniref:Leucine-rich repeat domain-containing protein n=1 Tax=hydrothermal vent metagenome TaxID=652676 RepID=A0A3B1DKN1_9ZZZZ